ncbi:hypothetical protein PV762_02300 [Mitsuaria sp. CC2]|uniref:hypothetical protein n=1 Tax=Mitsuaria sp. CC2 TaxID=3029186 RepID=UPI003B8CAE37
MNSKLFLNWRYYRRMDLQNENRRRLRKLGWPDNFFEPDFWEKELAARRRELEMLECLEARYSAGGLGVNVPWPMVFAAWRKQIEHPLHFASQGRRPRWMDALNDAASDWRQRERGSRVESWRRYRARQRLKR